jgi:hypothetical protein
LNTRPHADCESCGTPVPVSFFFMQDKQVWHFERCPLDGCNGVTGWHAYDIAHGHEGYQNLKPYSQEIDLMPDEDSAAEMRDLMAQFKERIAEYKEQTEQTLITVIQVKVKSANDPELLHVYEAAVKKEQELTNILKLLDTDMPT